MVPDASGNTNLALSATARLPRQDKPSPFAATSGLFGCRRVDWMNFVSRKSCRGQRAQHVISSQAAKAIPSILKGRSCINDGRRGCPPPPSLETFIGFQFVKQIEPLRGQNFHTNLEAQFDCSPFRKSRWGFEPVCHWLAYTSPES